jgi:2-dehydropantoate 2-reductase
MKIVVLGAGGVGGYFGGRLAATGSDVTFVARGKHLAAMRANGLKITSPLGDTLVEDVKAVETIGEVAAADLVIVGVKLWDTEGIAASLRPLAEQGAAIVSFQNGVEKDAVLRAAVPAAAVMGGVCYIAATIAEPGVIAHGSALQRMVFGEYGGARSARAEALLAACQAAKIDAEISDSIERLIWEKFVFLVGLSGTTAMYREAIGPIREDQAKRRMLLDAMREVAAVGRAKGVPLSADFADGRLAYVDSIPAAMKASMAIDLDRGNRLELPWLSGAVVKMGASLGIATPANRIITDALTPFVQGKQR